MKICVFCSSSDAVSPAYHAAASEMGELIGKGGHTLVFGGGRVGLMGSVARAAHAGGARVIGVIPRFMNQAGVAYPEADELTLTEGMRERKALMMEISEAFVALPGGFGTLEEISEVITQKQFDFLKKPLALVNTAGFFERFYAERFAKPDFRSVCAFVRTPAEAMGYIGDFRPPAPVRKWC